MTRTVSQSEFHQLARTKRARGVGVMVAKTDEPIAVAEDCFRFCLSDSSVDRMGDTIAVAGWDLAAFKRNPVCLWSHQSGEPPVGRWFNVGIEGQRLMGTVQMAGEAYPFAETVRRLLAGKWLKACSVGFIPKSYRFVDNDPDRVGGVNFFTQELLECSLTPLGANQNALSEARAAGVDTRHLKAWAERMLDSGRPADRPALNRLRAWAAEPPRHTPAVDSLAGRLARARRRKVRLESVIHPPDPLTVRRNLAHVAALRARFALS
jgi:HK97 family phage prohead protease